MYFTTSYKTLDLTGLVMTYNDDSWEIEVRQIGSSLVYILVKNKVSNTLFDDTWLVSVINFSRDAFAITIRDRIQQRYDNET